MAKNLLVLEDKRFNSMVRAMRKNTTADLKQVVRTITGSVVEQAARKTGRTNAKKLRKDVEERMAAVFTAKNGDKIRRGKDGSLVYKSSRMTGNRWIRLRKDYKLNAISTKNPSGIELGKKLKSSVNRSLQEMRAAVKKMYNRKKAQIASGQASFLYMLKLLQIPLKSTRGLGAALKVKLPSEHRKAVSAKGRQTGFTNYVILIKTQLRAALNPTARGRRAFLSSFYGQMKSFRVKTEKQIEKTAKKFASKNGFRLK
jgi:hypothetical protein